MAVHLLPHDVPEGQLKPATTTLQGPQGPPKTTAKIMQTTSTGWRFISNCTQFHLLFWMFPTIGVPQKLDGLSWNTLWKWMIWGEKPYFWKHSIWNPSILTGWRLGHHPKGKNHFRSLEPHKVLGLDDTAWGQWGNNKKTSRKPWWHEWHGHKM